MWQFHVASLCSRFVSSYKIHCPVRHINGPETQSQARPSHVIRNLAFLGISNLQKASPSPDRVVEQRKREAKGNPTDTPKRKEKAPPRLCLVSLTWRLRRSVYWYRRWSTSHLVLQSSYPCGRHVVTEKPAMACSKFAKQRSSRSRRTAEELARLAGLGSGRPFTNGSELARRRVCLGLGWRRGQNVELACENAEANLVGRLVARERTVVAVTDEAVPKPVSNPASLGVRLPGAVA